MEAGFKGKITYMEGKRARETRNGGQDFRLARHELINVGWFSKANRKRNPGKQK